jgi:nicotinate-nucleotide adenylyltransferase
MNICLFGGTFDPVHKGHIEIARAAADRFQLKQVLFCPAQESPFKLKQKSAPYAHRFAMLALATQEDRRFLVSEMESAEVTGGQGPNYTIDTVRRLQKRPPKSARLFFLCGADTFKDIAKWRESEALLAACEFIVAARPGFPIVDIAAALPDSLRPNDSVLNASRSLQLNSLVLPGAKVHLLTETAEQSSSTEVRLFLGNKKAAARHLHPAVAEYIKKHGLYRAKETGAESEPETPAKKAVVVNFPKKKS